MFFLDFDNKIKKVSPDEFKSQKRSGKGKNVDVRFLENGNNRDYLFIFGTNGKVYVINLFDLPVSALKNKGNSLFNYIEDKDIEISKILLVNYDNFHNNKEEFFLITTSLGIYKESQI